METIKKIISWDYIIKLEIRLEDKDQKNFDILKKLKKPVFSVSAVVWYKGRAYTAGQCLDEINEILEKNGGTTKERATLYYLRKKHHLNDLHAGTPKQEARLKNNAWLLRAYGITGRASNYSETCDLLKRFDLYNDEGREFGTGWNYWEIPADDLAEIKKFFIF